MSSLAMLMQNYSDSEEDGSSDEERTRKRLKRRSREEDVKEDDLNKDELSEDDGSNEDQLTKQRTGIELSKNESNSLTNSPELTPSLDQMKLSKLTEQQNATKQGVNYQDYLEDDFFTLNSNGNDEELDTNDDDSTPSIIDDDNDEKINNDTSSNHQTDQVEKLDCSAYSPKSYHRLLIGTDEQNIQIPDAPSKQCSEELTEKVINYHNKMKQGMDMNKSIQSMKSFRNPSIYEKLITFCNIDEFGTNLPPEIFDPNQFREKEPTEHDSST